MIQQLKLAAFVLLTTMSLNASGSDYTVTWSTTIESQRPIWLLILEIGFGVLNENQVSSLLRADGIGRTSGAILRTVQTTLSVDGREQAGRTSALAAWRLAGFILWGADGSVERTTTGAFRGHAVRIVDGAFDGRIWCRVVVGPPLGDPRVKFAVLELEATDVDEKVYQAGSRAGATIRLACSAIIDLPCDARRERVHARRQRRGCDRPTLSERIAGDEAGPELSSRVQGLADAGRRAVLAGHVGWTDSMVAEFLNEVCR